MVSKLRFPIAMCLFLALLSTLALADGGFFPPNNYKEDIYEPTQKAMIIFDGSVEQLIIEASYKGEMADFAWVIPTPSYPDINKSTSRLFQELSTLTKPIYKRAPSTFSFGATMKMSAGVGEGVTVLEQKQVGIFLVTVLSSDDPKALLKWLNDNNYQVSADASAVLDYYIQKRWYFTAMRVNLEPYDQIMLDSLKSINPSITSKENAVTLLSNDITDAIKLEKLYSHVPELSTPLKYGDSSESNSRYEYSMPQVIITENEYTILYEQYNGYFEYHINQEIKESIGSILNRETYPDGNKGYFTKSSPEYSILKDSDCGGYCSLISPSKESYSIEDISTAAAEAIINGGTDVKSFFGASDEKREWYDNEKDLLNYIKGQVSQKLYDQIRIKLIQETVQKYSSMMGQTFYNTELIKDYIAGKTMEDFKQNNGYSGSYIGQFGIITDSEYDRMKRLYEGNHDQARLYEGVNQKVSRVVNWKQTTVQKALAEGTVQPIYMKFSSASIIYPLKISSVNKGVSEILIYVFAKYRTNVQTISGFEVEYAQWIDTEDIETETYQRYVEELSKKPEMMPNYYSPTAYYNLNQLLDDRYFLTKLRKEMWPKEMTDDLLITQEKNNDEYIMVEYQKNYVLSWILFFVYMIILFSIIFGVLFLPKWINNVLIGHNSDSPFYITIKRSLAYAAVIPIFIIIGVFSDTFVRFIEVIAETIVRPFSDLFEGISHLLNLIGLPRTLNELIIVILVGVSIFMIVHLIGTLVIFVCKKIKSSKKEEVQSI